MYKEVNQLNSSDFTEAGPKLLFNIWKSSKSN